MSTPPVSRNTIIVVQSDTGCHVIADESLQPNIATTTLQPHETQYHQIMQEEQQSPESIKKKLGPLNPATRKKTINLLCCLILFLSHQRTVHSGLIGEGGGINFDLV